MSIKLRVTTSGTKAWKDVAEIKLRVGSLWKNVSAAYVRVSSTWKVFFAAISTTIPSIASRVTISTSNSSYPTTLTGTNKHWTNATSLTYKFQYTADDQTEPVIWSNCTGPGASGTITNPTTTNTKTYKPLAVEMVASTTFFRFVVYAVNANEDPDTSSSSNSLSQAVNRPPMPVTVTRPTLSGTGCALSNLTATSGTYQSGTYVSKTTDIVSTLTPELYDNGGTEDNYTVGIYGSPHEVEQSSATNPSYYFLTRDTVFGTDSNFYFFYSLYPIKAKICTVTDNFNRTAGGTLGTMSSGHIYNWQYNYIDVWSVNGSQAVSSGSVTSGTLTSQWPLRAIETGGRPNIDAHVHLPNTNDGGLGLAFWATGYGSFWAATTYKKIGPTRVLCTGVGGSCKSTDVGCTGCTDKNSSNVGEACGCTSSSVTEYPCTDYTIQDTCPGTPTYPDPASQTNQLCKCDATVYYACNGAEQESTTPCSESNILNSPGGQCNCSSYNKTIYECNEVGGSNYTGCPTMSSESTAGGNCGCDGGVVQKSCSGGPSQYSNNSLDASTCGGKCSCSGPITSGGSWYCSGGETPDANHMCNPAPQVITGYGVGQTFEFECNQAGGVYSSASGGTCTFPPAPSYSATYTPVTTYYNCYTTVCSGTKYTWYTRSYTPSTRLTYTYKTRSNTDNIGYKVYYSGSSPVSYTNYVWSTNEEAPGTYDTYLRIYSASGSTAVVQNSTLMDSSEGQYVKVAGISVATSGNSISAAIYSDNSYSNIIGSQVSIDASSPVKVDGSGSTAAGIVQGYSVGQAGSTFDDLYIQVND